MKGEDTTFSEDLRDIEMGWVPWVMAAAYFPVYILLDFAAGDLVADRLGLPQSVSVGLVSLAVASVVVIVFVLANVRHATPRAGHGLETSSGRLARGWKRLIDPLAGAFLTLFVVARDGVAVLLEGLWSVVAWVGGHCYRGLAFAARPFVLLAGLVTGPSRTASGTTDAHRRQESYGSEPGASRRSEFEASRRSESEASRRSEFEASRGREFEGTVDRTRHDGAATSSPVARAGSGADADVPDAGAPSGGVEDGVAAGGGVEDGIAAGGADPGGADDVGPRVDVDEDAAGDDEDAVAIEDAAGDDEDAVAIEDAAGDDEDAVAIEDAAGGEGDEDSDVGEMIFPASGDGATADAEGADSETSAGATAATGEGAEDTDDGSADSGEESVDESDEEWPDEWISAADVG